jgi:CDP-ribitol ribitolphosphotransferase
MKTLLINICIALMKVVYSFIKLSKTRHKVCFISRQSDQPTLDFIVLAAELHSRDAGLQIEILTKTLGPGLRKLIYPFHIVKQMRALATSHVCIIDSYCVSVSVLKHKKTLKVIQIWHAIGQLKKAGYSILNKNEGRERKLTHSLKMHRNYDVILASSSECCKAMCETFGCSEDKVMICPLPRVDKLKNSRYMSTKRSEILKAYPQLKNKKTILYVPTYRRNEVFLQKKLDELIEAVDFDRYNFVLSPHSLSKISAKNMLVLMNSRFTSMEMLSIADYIISDYSSIIFEALLYKRPVYYYSFDFECYRKNRGFFIDYETEIPGKLLFTGKEVLKAIETDTFDAPKANDFLDRYVKMPEASCTTTIADMIMTKI